MASDNKTYWRARMQDELHSFDNSYKLMRHSVLENARHIKLEPAAIRGALEEIRTAMINLAIAIEKSPEFPEDTKI